MKKETIKELLKRLCHVAEEINYAEGNLTHSEQRLTKARVSYDASRDNLKRREAEYNEVKEEIMQTFKEAK